jgi:hypothetical protein
MHSLLSLLFSPLCSPIASSFLQVAFELGFSGKLVIIHYIIRALLEYLKKKAQKVINTFSLCLEINSDFERIAWKILKS